MYMHIVIQVAAAAAGNHECSGLQHGAVFIFAFEPSKVLLLSDTHAISLVEHTHYSPPTYPDNRADTALGY